VDEKQNRIAVSFIGEEQPGGADVSERHSSSR
jgi:hypothetical protein